MGKGCVYVVWFVTFWAWLASLRNTDSGSNLLFLFGVQKLKGFQLRELCSTDPLSAPGPSPSSDLAIGLCSSWVSTPQFWPGDATVLKPPEMRGFSEGSRSWGGWKLPSPIELAMIVLYRVAHKIWHTYNFKYWPIINVFHFENQEKICNNTVTTDLTTPHMCRYFVKYRCLTCLKTKTTSVITHFKSASSSSKAGTLNIWCKNCRMWQLAYFR